MKNENDSKLNRSKLVLHLSRRQELLARTGRPKRLKEKGKHKAERCNYADQLEGFESEAAEG